ncbi:hypothetical protein A6E01_19565 (plasmid) [Vibrio breoganii]|uniref:Uncharacterized protein n=1 Tax=Vibrio breoganii TaxID=553239 RepID=A0AAN0XZG5_9VIBR|nr:hypothetical protein [Vibrio breoganii]ANO35413.1 hypothetical protein A6E01_19565 [Vibrio breoganii]
MVLSHPIQLHIVGMYLNLSHAEVAQILDLSERSLTKLLDNADIITERHIIRFGEFLNSLPKRTQEHLYRINKFNPPALLADWMANRNLKLFKLEKTHHSCPNCNSSNTFVEGIDDKITTQHRCKECAATFLAKSQNSARYIHLHIHKSDNLFEPYLFERTKRQITLLNVKQ